MTYFLHNDALHATTGKVRQVDGIVLLTEKEYLELLEAMKKRAKEDE